MLDKQAKQLSMWLDIWANDDGSEGVSTQGKESLVTIGVVSCKDKWAIGSAKRVSRSRNEKSWARVVWQSNGQWLSSRWS
jgi:hypothetical protein